MGRTQVSPLAPLPGFCLGKRIFIFIEKTNQKLIMFRMNAIDWKPKAARQLRKIRDMAMQQRIYREVQVLADFPNCTGVKHLTDHEYNYRLRVGDYRVFFEFDGAVRIVHIEEVRKRDERTY